MSKDLERYYSAIRGTSLAQQRGIDKALEAEQSAQTKIREMTAAAEGDISSRSARIAQLEKWINSAQADGVEARLPDPTGPVHGVEDFGPFRQSLERISHLREQLSKWGSLDTARAAENQALKRATVIGFASVAAGLLTLIFGETLLAWLILPVFGIAAAGLIWWRWYDAEPPAGEYTFFRIQRGENIGMSFGGSAIIMVCTYILASIPVTIATEVARFVELRTPDVEGQNVFGEFTNPILTLIGFVVLAGAVLEVFAFRESSIDDTEKLPTFRGMTVGLTSAGRALIVAGIVNYVLGLVALITSIAPWGGYTASLLSVVAVVLGLALHCTGQRVARKLSDSKRESMQKKRDSN